MKKREDQIYGKGESTFVKGDNKGEIICTLSQRNYFVDGDIFVLKKREVHM